MVLLTIHVRPKNGYSYPRRIKTIEVDSSKRLEEVVADLKLDTKKGIALFSSHGRLELALNSSLASNNIQSGDILETCSSPLLSAVLSAVIEDLNQVKELADDERTQERIEPLLGLTTAEERLDPWPDRWNHDSLKTRIICLAFLKKVIQRHDRFAHLIVPECRDLHVFHEFLQEKVLTSPSDRRGSMAHIFKPSNKDGQPTTCWQLLQFKLNKISAIRAAIARASGAADATTGGEINCSIERFLVVERERHEGLKEIHSPQQASAAAGRKKPPPGSSNTANGDTPGQEPKRKRRRLAIESPSVRLGDREWTCVTCETAAADCMCLTASCPFHKQPSCHGCFSANHPMLQRDHDRIQFTDTRAKSVLKALHREDRQNLYCPEYASGPFAVLCTLYDQMMNYKQLSLPETRLKELAQRICRSNLYDHQARGRNAFACMEGLMERNLVRMERLPGRTDQEGKYSLLPEGEALAKYCFSFEQEVNATVHQNPNVLRHKREALDSGSSSNNPISIIVDTREDRTFADRLIQRCQQEDISAEKRELPAGDYLFTVDDRVCPIVLERKSWSDLADSVLGKGQRRLDCVRIGDGSGGPCENGRCQLCKMKASGCAKIMFVVEGARCANLGGTSSKCTEARRCQFCRELQQRHGRTVVQEALEDVLYQLQADHGCFVHYTRSYNETIDTLILMREILGAGIESQSTGGVATGIGDADDIARAIALSLGRNPTTASRTTQKSLFAAPTLSYEQFCSNARRKPSENDMMKNCNRMPGRGQLEELDDKRLIRSVFDGTIEAYCIGISKGTKIGKQAVLDGAQRRRRQDSKPKARRDPAHTPHEVVDLNETFNAARNTDDTSDVGDSDVEVLDRGSVRLPAKKCLSSDCIIEIDSEDDDVLNDSQEWVQIIDFPVHPSGGTASKKLGRHDSDDDEIEVLLAVKPDAASSRGDMCHSELNTKQPLRAPSPILLVFGLLEYDMDFYKDISEIWRYLYHRDKSSVSVGVSFRSSCRTKLRTVQDTQEISFVDRKSLLFWLLYMQLACDIRVHVMRQKRCKQRLESRRDNRRCHVTSSVVPAAADISKKQFSAKRATSLVEPAEADISTNRPSAKRAHLGAPPRPKELHKCIICKANLGIRELEVTPCGHTFHSGCLHQWFSSQAMKNRRCPKCNHELGAFKDGSGSTAQQATPKPRRIRTPAAQSSSAQSLREARLARFEVGSSSACGGSSVRRTALLPVVPPSAVTSADSYQIQECWDCAKCTYQNKMQDQYCSACCTVRPGRTEWACRACTYKNQLGTSTCSACDTQNPDFFEGSVMGPATPIVERRNVESSYGDTDDLLPTVTRARTAPNITSSSKPSKVKCGACGQFGHNRASACPENCPNYFDDDEVEQRAKKKEENKRKAQQAREERARLERNGVVRDAQVREAQRVLANLEQSVAADAPMRQNEIKRLKRKEERAQKQARKYG